MSILDSGTILTSPINRTAIYDDAFQTLTNVIVKSVTSHKDQLSQPVDLVLGATNNVEIESVTSVQTHVKDTGLVKFYVSTGTSEEEFLRIYKPTNDASSTSNDIPHNIIASGSNMPLILTSGDAEKTAQISGLTMMNTDLYQYIASTETLKMDTVGVAMSNIVASDHVFAKDFNLIKTNQGASNVGDIAGSGYSFRMNDKNHLELIKYTKFLEEGRSRDVYVKVATFGNANISRDYIGDVQDYDAFQAHTTIDASSATIQQQLDSDTVAAVDASAVPWIAGVQGAIAAKTDSQGNTYLVGVNGYVSTTVPWVVPTTLYNADVTVSPLIIHNPTDDVKLFIIKYDSSGVILWTRGIAGGTGLDFKTAYICFDSRNYISIVSHGTTTSNFQVTYPNATTVAKTCAATPSGKNADIVTTFSHNGEFIDMVQIYGVEANVSGATSGDMMPVGKFDANNNLYITGVYDRASTLNVINFDGQTSFISIAARTPASVHTKVAYIAKFNASKRVLWMASPGFKRWKSSIGIDGLGNIYTAGYAYKECEPVLNADGTISGVTLGTFLYSNDTATSCVSLLKYNSSGVAQWAAGSDMPYVNEYDVGVTVNMYDEVFLSGIFETTSNTQPFKVYNSSGLDAGFTWPTTYRPAGQYKATYYIKYNTFGVPQWSFMIESAYSDKTWVPSPIFDPSGNLIIAQGFRDDVIVFYNANGTTHRTLYPQGAEGGAYIAKYSAQTGTCMWADYAVTGLTEIRDVAGGAGMKDTYILMTTGQAVATGQVVTFADWSTATIPPVKTLLIKIVHDQGLPTPAPLPASPYPVGFLFSRFDNTADSFSITNKDFSWFAGKTYNASGVVPAITSAYSSTSTSTFTQYGVAGYGTNFALLLRGYFRPSRTGTWTFTLVANDYAMMWVGASAAAPGTSNTATNTLLTTDSTNSYDASMKTSASMSLVANQYYPVLIYYGQSDGDSALSLTYRGPSVANSSDGVGYYFYDNSWSAPYIPSSGLPSNVVLNTGTNELRTLADGDGVANWGVFNQSIVGNQPNFYNQSSSWLNGGYVSFSNSLRKFMYTPSPVTLNIGTNGGLSYALLIKFKDVVTSEQILSSTGSNVLSISRSMSTNTLDFTGSAVSNAATALNTWYIFTYRLDNAATRVTIKRDNVTLLDNMSATTKTFNGSVRIGLGSTATSSDESGTLWTSADIGALIVYDRALTDSEMSLLYTYVSSGYATMMSIQNPPAPSPTQSTLTLPMIAGAVTYTVALDKYFVYATSYTLLSNPQSSASISGSTLSIAGANRNTTYTLSVSATNAIGTSATNISIFVTESPPPPVLIAGSTAAMSVSGTTTTTLSLASYFMYATSYTVVSDPMGSGASISGSTLSVTGAFRNTSYVIVVSASKGAGTASSTLTVSVTEDTYTSRTLLMYDASTLTEASGSVVSSWPNVSSLGSAFNVTSANSPKVIVDANGKGIDFTASSSQRFSLSTSSTLCSLNNFVQNGGVYGGATVVMVVKFRTPRVNSERLLTLSSSTDTNNQLFIGRADATASYASDIYNGSTSINNQLFFNTKVTGVTAIVDSVAQVFVTTYANISATQHKVQHYINGSTPFDMDVSPIRNGTISNRTFDRIEIGCFAGTSNFTNAIIYQAMVINEVLNTAGIAFVVDDLKSKWNVQASYLTSSESIPPTLTQLQLTLPLMTTTTPVTVNLAQYILFATSYELSSDPYSSASISGTTLTISPSNRDTSYSILVNGSNISGTTVSPLTVYVSESPPIPTTLTDVLELTLTNTSVDVDLSQYFEYETSYTLVANPVNNASILSSILSLQGAFRNTTYTVEVTASNIAGTSVINLSILVTETAPLPLLLGNTSSLTLATLTSSTAVLTDMASYWTNATSYMIASNPQNSASLSGSVVKVTGAYRGTSYAVIVRGVNSSGTSQQFFTLNITEVAAPSVPYLSGVSSLAVTINTATATTIELSQYFAYGTTYTLLSNPQSSATVSGSSLVINGKYRNTLYSMIISASNILGTSSNNFTVNVTESAPVIERLPPTMSSTSLTTTDGTYKATASTSRHIDMLPWKAFNRVNTTDINVKWQSYDTKYDSSLNALTTPAFDDGFNVTSYKGEWIQITLPFSIYPTSWTVAGDPLTMRLYASNSSKVWTAIDERTQNVTYNTVTTYTLPSTSATVSPYKKFALKINRSRRDPGYGRCALMWLQIYGCRANVLTAEPPVPTLLSTTSLTLPSMLINTTPVTVNLSTYWSFATSYSLVSNPQNSASISGSTLTITGAYRNVTYPITLTASNVSGMSVRIFTVSVTEGPPVPSLKSTTPVTLLLLTITPSIIDVAQYFNDGSTYTIVSNPQSSASISSGTSTLTITGNNRDVMYTVSVSATNIAGTSAQTLFINVTEAPPAPTLTQSQLTLPLMTTTTPVEVNLAQYILYATSYELSSDPYSSASISGTTLTISPNNRDTSYSILVNGSNINGTTVSPLTVYVSESLPVPITVTDELELTLTNTSVDVDLSQYFEYGTSYTLVANPVNNASILSSILSLQGAFRNTTYTVQVTASNIAGTSVINLSILVTETAPLPLLSGGTSSLTLATLTSSTAVLTDVASYWTNATSYTITSNPQNSASITGSVVKVIGAYRDTSYAVIVRGVNSGGTSQQSFTLNITEVAAPSAPYLSGVSSLAVTINTATATTIELSQYFAYGTTYTLLSNPRSSATISGSSLVINGKYRNTLYSLIISASNILGTSTNNFTVNVTESAPVIERLPPTMSSTSLTTTDGTYKATASTSRHDDMLPWKAFNRVNTTNINIKWQSYDTKYDSSLNALTTPAFDDGFNVTSYKGEWIQITLPFSIYPTSWTVAGDPLTMRLYASNSSKVWTAIDERTQNVAYNTVTTYTLPSTSATVSPYKKFALKINRSRRDPGYGRCALMWLQIYGCRANVLTAEPPVPTLLSTTSLTSTLINTTPVTINLSTYWSFATSYSLVSNPQNSASISGSTLTITGAYRNMTYPITLTASNVSGMSVRIFTVSVTEGSAPI